MLDWIMVPYRWNKAEEEATKGNWDAARTNIDKALDQAGFTTDPKKSPALMVALAAVIYYRMGFFDSSYQLISEKFRSDGFFHKSLSATETDYLLIYLGELLEYMAGTAISDQKRFLDLTTQISKGRPYPPESEVRVTIRQFFPLSERL